MGKILIIKNADFSDVAVNHVTPTPEANYQWLYNFSDNDFSIVNQGLNLKGFWVAESSNLIGLHIKKIKFKCNLAGTVGLYKSTPTSETGDLITSIICNDSDVDKILIKDVNFTLNEGEYIAFTCSDRDENNNSSLMYYYNSDPETQSQMTYHNQFYNKYGTLMDGRDLFMDFYYEY